MTNRLTRLIPRMFHRRLLLLAALAALGLGVLIAQLARLTMIEGGQLRREAEAKLVRQSWTPTVRGRILDRKGRVLAHDRPSYDAVVDYRVITGEWAMVMAGQTARKANAERWRELSAQQRLDLTNRYLPAFEAHLDRMWDLFAVTARLDRDELDRRKAKVVDHVESLVEHIHSRRLAKLTRSHLEAGRALTADASERLRRQSERPIHEQRSPHALAARVSDEVAFAFMGLADQTVSLDTAAGPVLVPLMPGLGVIDSGLREYPYETVTVDVDRSTFPPPLRYEGTESVTVDGVGVHVLGRMRDSYQQPDVEARAERIEQNPSFRERVCVTLGGDESRLIDLGRYMTGDAAGHTGLEANLEQSLRGLRGLVFTHLDTGEQSITPRQHGIDEQLTIDIMLQARIRALMDPRLGLAVVQDWHANHTLEPGTPLYGAAVVLDVDTGDILAMVSTPTYTRQQLSEDPASVFDDPVATPFVDRTIAKPYPPGSVAKALILASAVTRGVFRLDETIECTGHLYPDKPNMFRCWIYKRYGTTHTAQLGRDLSPIDALTVSCNIFFYTLGRRLGPTGIIDTYKSFGVGEGWNLGAGQEFPGQIGPNGRTDDIGLSDATLMGIGQGPIAWTPLHAAAAFATLARGGVRITPRLRYDQPAQVTDIGLDQDAVATALDGLYSAVNEPLGTGYGITYNGRKKRIFDDESVWVWGKTGTAQAPDIVADPDGDGPEPTQVLRHGDHSWFVVLCGPAGDRPRYAVAVLMEYAGSGGRVSGPIVNQIIHALKAEGYL